MNKTLAETTLPKTKGAGRKQHRLIKSHSLAINGNKKSANVYHHFPSNSYLVRHYINGKHNSKLDHIAKDEDSAHKQAKSWLGETMFEQRLFDLLLEGSLGNSRFDRRLQSKKMKGQKLLDLLDKHSAKRKAYEIDANITSYDKKIIARKNRNNEPIYIRKSNRKD